MIGNIVMHVKWDRPTGNIHGRTRVGWMSRKFVDACKVGTGQQETHMTKLGSAR